MAYRASIRVPLLQGVSATDTSLFVQAALADQLQGFSTLILDPGSGRYEEVTVSSVNTTTGEITVSRGANGTTALAHNSGGTTVRPLLAGSGGGGGSAYLIDNGGEPSYPVSVNHYGGIGLGQYGEITFTDGNWKIGYGGNAIIGGYKASWTTKNKINNAYGCSIVGGSSNEVNSGGGVVLGGYGNYAKYAYNGVAFGKGNSISSTGATAFGQNNQVNDHYGLAVGTGNIADSEHSMAMGENNKAYGFECLAVGEDNYVKSGASNAIALGFGNIVDDDAAAALGEENQIYNGAEFGFAGGFQNLIHAYAGTAFGKQNNVQSAANYSFAAGYDNTLSASKAGAVGSRNTVSASGGLAFGLSNTVAGVGSLASGFENYIGGRYSQSVGKRNKSNGNYSLSVGRKAYAYGAYSVAMGYKGRANSAYASAVGAGEAGISGNVAQKITQPMKYKSQGVAGQYAMTPQLYVGSNAGSCVSFGGRVIAKTDSGYYAGWEVSGLAYSDGTSATVANYSLTKTHYTGGSGGAADQLALYVQATGYSVALYLNDKGYAATWAAFIDAAAIYA